MINENKSSCYPEIETYKQEVCSPYNELWAIMTNVQPHPRISSTWKKKTKELKHKLSLNGVS